MSLVGERRAIAAAVLSFFMLQFIIGGLLGDEQLRWVQLALGAAYLVAFTGVVAGWFWARWYTLGLTFSGLAMAALIGWKIGVDINFYIIGGGHLALGIGLLGTESATFFEGRKDWRERWHMDQNAVNRLGKAVMRAGASLPYLIVAGLMPRQGGMAIGVLALGLGLVGFSGVVRMRTWGLVALTGATAFAGAHLVTMDTMATGLPLFATGAAALLLAAAVSPFVAPMVRALRAR